MNFWSEVPQNIENLLESLVTIKNHDLLIDLPETLDFPPCKTPSPEKLKLKSSWLYGKYPLNQQSLDKGFYDTLKYSKTQRKKMIIPLQHRNKSTIPVDNPKLNFTNNLSNLEIKGNCAKVILPKISDKITLEMRSLALFKKNWEKIKEKYKQLYYKIKGKDKDKKITKEQVMEYLQCTQKSKTKHKIKINERNSYKFNTSKHIHLPYVNDIMEYPPYIISKSLIIMVYII